MLLQMPVIADDLMDSARAHLARFTD